MVIGYILLELLLGAMILGFVGAYKKRLFDRLILIATVPLAFIVSIFTTNTLFKNATVTLTIEERIIVFGTEEFPAEAEIMSNLASALIGPVVAVVLFWVLLFLFRIIAGIALAIVHSVSGCRTREKEAKREYKEAKREGRDAKEEDAENSIFHRYKKPLWHKLTTGAIGAVSGFLIIMFSMLPIVYISNIAEPAVEKALAAENEGTYVNEIAKTVNENFMILSDKSAFGRIQKLTGMRAIANAAVGSLTDIEIETENGKIEKFNLSEVLVSLADYGVDAAVAYERACASGATLKSLDPLSDVFVNLSEDDGIITAVFTVYDNMKTFIFDEEKLNDLPYDVTSAEALSSDLKAAAGLLDIACEDLGHLGIGDEDLLNEILAYLENEESAKKLVNVLGTANAYKTNFPTLMELALGMIADQLDLPEDKADDYEMFIADMTEALNNKSFGTYDEAEVDKFIKYAADSGLVVKDYTVANRAEPTETDVAYLNYIEFIERKNDIEEVYTNKLLDNSKNLSYYITADNSIYVYSTLLSIWAPYTEGELKESSYAAVLLTNEVNELMKLDPATAIDSEDAKNLARAAALNIGSHSFDIAVNTATSLSAIFDVEDYDPENPVYRESIVNALNKDAVIDEEHNNSFATALTVMAKLYGSLTAESDEASIDTIMDNFHLVGRLLDSLKAMESTSEVPDKMLDAIMQNKNYGKFFSADAVQKTLDNIKDGRSTYEELFTTVQGVYGLASGIIPT